LIFNNYVDFSRSDNKFNFFDTGTDFSEGPDYHVTAANLSEVLNEGFNIFHFAGHGYNQSLNMESGKGFDSHDARNLTNQKSGIVISNACNVNAFEACPICLLSAEQFPRHSLAHSCDKNPK